MQYKNFRSNPMRSRNGRPTSGHCVECGRVTSEALGGKRVTIPAQKNGVWMCEVHRGRRNLHDYGEENSTLVGTGNADNISISLELESMGISTHARAYLVSNDFIATSDSTVTIEYKSPIYTSEQALAKIIGGIEYMDINESYDFRVNDYNCGLHTHFGFIDNRYNFTRLYEDYKVLFEELNRIVYNLNNNDRIKIFGRSWGEYNDVIDFDCPSRHENWINIQHSYSLEIRMPRFINAVQYMKFLKTFKKMFKALDTHYISKGAQNNYNHVRNAQKASKKMCAIFCKAYNLQLENGTYRIVTPTTTATVVVDNSNRLTVDGTNTTTLAIDDIVTTNGSANITYDSIARAV